MLKRTHFSTMTPLPSTIKRESVVEILHSHCDMIDLNPLVVERHRITPPDSANREECLWKWYRIHYGLNMGYLKYDVGFHDIENGVETLAYAPLGVQTRSKWTLGETRPRDQPVNGAPAQGLYLSEDVELRCPILFTWYTKRTLKKAHVGMMERFIAKAEGLSGTKSDGQQHDTNESDPSSLAAADRQEELQSSASVE